MKINKNKRYKVVITKDKKFGEDIVTIRDKDEYEKETKDSKKKRPKMSEKEKKNIRDFLLYSGIGLVGAVLLYFSFNDPGHWGDY